MQIKNQIVFIMAVFFSTMMLQAQTSQSFFMNQYQLNRYLQNPGFAGMEGGQNVHFFTRNDPPTGLFPPLYNYAMISWDSGSDTGRIGYGANIEYQREYNEFTSGLALSFSYSITHNDDYDFRIGFSLSGRYKSVAFDPNTNPNLLGGRQGKIYPLVHAGLALQAGPLSLGFSGYNLNRPTLSYLGINIIEYRVFLLYAAYDLYEDLNFKFTPSVLVRKFDSNRIPVYDINMNLLLVHKLLLSLGYRGGGIPKPYIIGQAGANFGKYSVALSYEKSIFSNRISVLNYIEGTFTIKL